MIEAVIFDCDGVLVDSEPLAWEAWRRVLETFGLEVTEDDIRQMTGRSQFDVHAAFAARASLPPLSELKQEISSVLFGLFERELRVFPDVAGTIDALAERGIRLAVASSSPRVRLDRTLAVVDLTASFETSVAGDEVHRAKPEPDLFLKAAEQLAVSPARCVAIEDSPAGVHSARAAGMCVVGVLRGQYTRSELAAANQIVDCLDAASILLACSPPASTS